jgi:hypothetical protein
MEFDSARIRPAEWLLALVSLLLLIDLFALPWFGATATFAPGLASLGLPTQTSGAHLLVLGPLTLFTAVAGLISWLLQATRRGPALPVAATSITEGLALLTFVGLFIRVLLVPPGVLIPGSGGLKAIESLYGGYLGLVLSAALLLASYRSLRQDGIAPSDAPARIEVFRLAQR